MKCYSMSRIPLSITNRLKKRLLENSFRTLKPCYPDGVDFYSNDYLGFSRDKEFQTLLLEKVSASPSCLTSSTGSRLLSGNNTITESAEQYIASQHQVEHALLFSSGYAANLALLGCVPTRQSTVIIDEYAHRSIHDGCRLSGAKKWKFKHNNLSDLQRLLEKVKGEVFVVAESLYSMDGDSSPLQELVDICNHFGAYLIIDEAHALGVYGLGLLHTYNLHNAVFATTVTYGKAMGVQGAAVLGSKALIEMLINFGTSFIYSTAAPTTMARSIIIAYQYLDQATNTRKQLFAIVDYYRQRISPFFPTTTSPIQIIQLKDFIEVDKLLEKLHQEQLNVLLIKAPTVPVGSERFRICLHAHNTTQQIDKLLTLVLQHKKQE